MKNINRTLLCTFIALALSGCDRNDASLTVGEPASESKDNVSTNHVVDSDKPVNTVTLIDAVKGYIYDDIDPTLKVGSALKTRHTCQLTSWEEKVDHRERDVAVYSCVHHGYGDYFNSLENERLAIFVGKTESAIPALKAKAEDAEQAFNDYSWYHSFIEHLKDKGLIDGLIKIKQQESGDYRYLSYLINPEKSQYLADRNPEIKEIYNGIFTVLDEMLGSNEVDESVNMSDVHVDEREKLYDNIVNNGFKTFIDDIAEEGSSALAIESINAKAKTLSDKLNEANGQLEVALFQLTDEGMKNRVTVWSNDKPANIVSNISFAMGKDRPYVVDCRISFYTSESLETPAYVKHIDDVKTCLTENYKEEYDNFYINSFIQFYQNRIGEKV